LQKDEKYIPEYQLGKFIILAFNSFHKKLITVSINQLISYFNTFIPLKNEEKEGLRGHVVERKVKRKQFVLQDSDVCRHYTFVAAGLLKMYTIDRNGTEPNIQFAAENEWIMDIGSFHSESRVSYI
jgi:CRP-like cAMP-binding protein